MKEILRYLAYHLLRQLDGRGGIRGYYRALLGDVQLVKIHSYPKHIPARGCIVRVRHSWNVRIIFYRDPFFFFFFFFFFFLFTRPRYVGSVKVAQLAGHYSKSFAFLLLTIFPLCRGKIEERVFLEWISPTSKMHRQNRCFRFEL